MSDPLVHRCADPECISYRQVTDRRSCRCHKTREQMAEALIAEMLEALRDFVWRMEAADANPVSFEHIADKARAAIAKATGGQPSSTASANRGE